MIIPDVNLLVYAHNGNSPNYRIASLWWEGLLNGLENIGLPWAVSTGFVRISTNPSVMTPLAPLQAVDYVESWLARPHVTPIEPGPNHMTYFRRNIEAVGVGRNLVTDAHLAALAIEYEAEFHTNDADFGRFPGLRWRNPLGDG